MKTHKIKPYGYELILDLHGCDPSRFHRRFLRGFCERLCKAIKMDPCKLIFWDDKWTWLWKLIFFWDRNIRNATEPHTKGTSAVQFILTSNITIHCLDEFHAVYINIFSCKPFKPKIAEDISEHWFDAESCSARFIERI